MFESAIMVRVSNYSAVISAAVLAVQLAVIISDIVRRADDKLLM